MLKKFTCFLSSTRTIFVFWSFLKSSRPPVIILEASKFAQICKGDRFSVSFTQIINVSQWFTLCEPHVCFCMTKGCFPFIYNFGKKGNFMGWPDYTEWNIGNSFASWIWFLETVRWRNWGQFLKMRKLGRDKKVWMWATELIKSDQKRFIFYLFKDLIGQNK